MKILILVCIVCLTTLSIIYPEIKQAGLILLVFCAGVGIGHLFGIEDGKKKKA